MDVNLMMLKQSSIRNHQRSRRLISLKRSFQICVILIIFMWFLYQFKRAHNNEDRPKQESENEGIEYHHQLVNMGRKGLKEQGSDFVKRDDIIAELDIEDEEGISVLESQEGNNDKDEEIEADEDKEANDNDEAENTQLQDLIDEDDKEQ